MQRLVRDAIGAGNLLGHTAMRPLPIDLASLIGQEIWSRVGRIRYPDVNARMAEVWTRLRPTDSAPATVNAVVAGMWCNIGRVIGEYSVLDRLWPAGRIGVEGAAHVSAARNDDRPVIVMGLHLGNWETIAPALSGSGYPLSFIYQRPADRIDHHLVVTARRRYKVDLLPLGPRGARAALRALQQRRVLLIFADEWINDSINAPAFGRPPRLTGNIANVARLAAMTDAAVVPAYALRTNGANFQLRFLPPVELAHSGDGDTDLAENVARLDSVIAPIIRAHLDQWLMLFDFRFDD